jgi:hypothetical protein
MLSKSRKKEIHKLRIWWHVAENWKERKKETKDLVDFGWILERKKEAKYLVEFGWKLERKKETKEKNKKLRFW